MCACRAVHMHASVPARPHACRMLYLRHGLLDYAIAFGPQSDIVQALIAGGAESLTDEYLKKFNVGEAFERPNQKGWGGARNRGRERGRSLGKEECRSRRERLTEDLRLAEETRLNPRRPVHLNEERHDHTVKERLLSKDGYPVFVRNCVRRKCRNSS